jgi:hypothetical protein
MERQGFGIRDEDLDRICRLHGVEPQVVKELLDIERRYHRQMRRAGIMDELADCIKRSTRTQRTADGETRK